MTTKEEAVNQDLSDGPKAEDNKIPVGIPVGAAPSNSISPEGAEGKDSNRRQEIEDLATPFFLIDWFVDHPCKIIAACLVVMNICLVLVVVFNVAELAPEGNRDYLDWGA